MTIFICYSNCNSCFSSGPTSIYFNLDVWSIWRIVVSNGVFFACIIVNCIITSFFTCI
ncbi:hypothetical protein [uncultured Methanobrevibacter sp.]|uniref:hypothetical protein n=1 Tax=uncultured Methanobrevibacter sp. TaxID=253161 RepID=UPI0025D30183|nr:hypothetical protein [uncultured Methanobrevibacter sp.]